MYFCFSRMMSILLVTILGSSGCSKFFSKAGPKTKSQQESAAGTNNFSKMRPTELPSPDSIESEILTPDLLKGFYGQNDSWGKPWQSTHACQALSELGKPLTSQARFRILEFVGGDPRVSFKKNKVGQYTGEVNFLGRIDIAANPLYQGLLFKEPIPNRDEIFSLLEEKGDLYETSRKKFPLLSQFIKDNRGTVELVVGFADRMGKFYEGRNKLLENHLINKFFPGVFDDVLRPRDLSDSLARIFVQKGEQNLLPFFPGPNPNNEDLDSYRKQIERILTIYGQPKPQFSGSTWREFEEDMIRSVNSGVTGLVSTNFEENACANVLFHRALSQLLRIQGLDQPALLENSEGAAQTSSLPSVKDWLETPTSSQFRVCPRPGPFVHNGERVQLTESRLRASAREYLLAARVPNESNCKNSEATAIGSPAYHQTLESFYRPSEFSGATDWFHFLSGMLHFAGAFHPKAPWWVDENSNPIRKNLMADFSDISKIKESGGSLPAQIHMLIGGIIRISGASLRKHVLVLDLEKNVLLPEPSTGDWPENLKSILEKIKNGAQLRVSEGRYATPLQTPLVSTHTRAVVLMSEIFLKLYPELEVLSEWHSQRRKGFPPGSVEGELAEKFFRASFGDEIKIIDYFFDEIFSELSPYVEDIRYGLAMLLAQMAIRTSDEEFSCADRMELDLNSTPKQEVKVGVCDPDTHKRWKLLMEYFGREYRSPIFYVYGKNK